MRWGQITAALVTAGGAAYVLLQRGPDPVRAAAAATVVFITTRTVLATLGRTRYWYSLGTRRAKRWQCGGCGQRIYRKGGDWILTCHRCGWRAGWPGVRWLTRSVPAMQLRRSVVLPHLVILLLAVTIIYVGVPFSPSTLGGGPPSGGGMAAATATPGHELTGTEPPSDGQPAIDLRRTEQRVFEQVNHRRQSRGMGAYNYNQRAAEAAREHARHMAANNYFSHTEPNGETQQERYAFCDGGENAAQTWVFRRVVGPDGATRTYTTAQELASGIVEQWMHSDPHRERGIFGEWWSSAGVGIAITDSGKVYAVMGFCT